MTPEDKYVSCIRCGYFITWLEHTSLHFPVDCPECGPQKVNSHQFGPGVYVDDFEGKTFQEAAAYRHYRQYATIAKESKS